MILAYLSWYVDVSLVYFRTAGLVCEAECVSPCAVHTHRPVPESSSSIAPQIFHPRTGEVPLCTNTPTACTYTRPEEGTKHPHNRVSHSEYSSRTFYFLQAVNHTHPRHSTSHLEDPKLHQTLLRPSERRDVHPQRLDGTIQQTAA